MKQFIKKDSYLIGAGVGLLFSAIILAIIYMIQIYKPEPELFNDPKVPYLISILPNLVLMRFQFVNFKKTKTGGGILFVTFLIVVLTFILIKNT
jgi:hypothetical protein